MADLVADKSPAKAQLEKNSGKKKVYDSADEHDQVNVGVLGEDTKPWWDIFGFACCAGDRGINVEDEGAEIRTMKGPAPGMTSPNKRQVGEKSPTKSRFATVSSTPEPEKEEASPSTVEGKEAPEKESKDEDDGPGE